jgi:hypothetical protein
MMNEVYGEATLHLIAKTELNEELFNMKFHEENIIDVKVQVTLSDGSVHIVDAFLNGIGWMDYLNYKKEKATKQNIA